MKRWLAAGLSILMLALFGAGCGGKDTKNPIATLELKNGKTIKIELFKEAAPETVANFIELAECGFYDDLTFHRVVPGFVVQAGDPKGDSSGGPGYTIKGEFSANGVDNPTEHVRGVVSMARREDDYDSAGSQFFICLADSPQLNGLYAAFGRVMDDESMAVVDDMATLTVDANGKPASPPVIKTIKIEK